MKKHSSKQPQLVTQPFENSNTFYSSELMAISKLFEVPAEDLKNNENVEITYDIKDSQGLLVYSNKKTEESIWVLVCRFSSKNKAALFEKTMQNILNIFKIRNRKKQVFKSNYTDSFNQFVKKFNEMNSERTLV